MCSAKSLLLDLMKSSYERGNITLIIVQLVLSHVHLEIIRYISYLKKYYATKELINSCKMLLKNSCQMSLWPLFLSPLSTCGGQLFRRHCWNYINRAYGPIRGRWSVWEYVKNMLKSVISAKDSRQTFTSLEEFSILFPALGHLLSGVWILWVHSLKQ